LILSERDVAKYIDTGRLKIEPIKEDTIQQNGVDLRIGKDYLLLRSSSVYSRPEDFTESPNLYYHTFQDVDRVKVPPLSRLLLTTKEYIELPNDLIGICQLRNFFVRMGLNIPPTVVAAGFKGNLTIELIGSTVAIQLMPNTRFLHIIFLKITSPSKTP